MTSVQQGIGTTGITGTAGTGNVIQEPQKNNNANEFEAWLNAPSPNKSGASGTDASADWLNMKNDNDHEVLIFYNNAQNPPQLVEREFPDKEKPGIMKKSTRAVLSVSRVSEPDRRLQWEVARTTLQVAWPMITRGFTVIDVTRKGRPGDPKTTYQFVPNVNEQQKIMLQQQKLAA